MSLLDDLIGPPTLGSYIDLPRRGDLNMSLAEAYRNGTFTASVGHAASFGAPVREMTEQELRANMAMPYKDLQGKFTDYLTGLEPSGEWHG